MKENINYFKQFIFKNSYVISSFIDILVQA